MNVHTTRNCFKAEMIANLKSGRTDSSIKKRDSQWENEVVKGGTSLSYIIAPPYGDRFIPRRYFSHRLNKNLKFATKNMEKDVLKVRFAANYWRQNSLKIAIDKSFELKEERILQLSDQTVKGFESHSYMLETIDVYSDEYDWRCIPRSKPLAFAETTHDSPGFDSTFDPNMVDWSVNGQIVASFGQDLIIWKRTDDVTMLFNVKSIKSLAFSPDGKILAIGCKIDEYPVLELWEVVNSTKSLVVNGKVFSRDHLNLHSMIWNQSGSQIICGTGFGCLYVLSVPDLKVLRKVRRHKMPINRIKLSPNMRYIASGDTSGDIVVYNWSSCDVYLVVCSKRKLHTDFDWHPWNGDDLVIAETVPASIVVLHVPSKEIVAYYQRMDRSIIINHITFSKITAELLVSVSMAGDDGCWDFKILIMSSLNRVVDLLCIPESGVRFVVWSPDGTRLATSGNDETLTIWNFCSENRTEYGSTIPKGKLTELTSKFGVVFKSWDYLK
ncbi:protein cortex isoform X1 [Zeugodacus cucurbitae]|uniref:protein cortex isoform X1 n=1 Tax=Zeugodacus cucurbitae TaxID=28588 RepID=UPI0023D8E858|nr:protein cortex isoform X1 [Zeugodacus cucurbitae]